MTLLDLRHAQYVSPASVVQFTRNIPYLEERALGWTDAEADQDVGKCGVTGVHRPTGDTLMEVRYEPVELDRRERSHPRIVGADRVTFHGVLDANALE